MAASRQPRASLLVKASRQPATFPPPPGFREIVRGSRTTLDSVDGYTEAAKDSGNSRFTALFTSRASERRQAVATLQQEVRTLGGNPEDDGTVPAGAHRVFLKLKATLTGKNDKAIINEVEAGEDHIKAKFKDAIADPDVSPAIRAVIERCYGSVKQGHDEMRDLKHSIDA